MGWGTGNIGGGSGGGLNFKVVGGTTEPTNPKENMIWVNTDQKITGWNFSATDPFNFKIASNAGDVVGTAGGVTFTKKNAGKAIFAFARNETFTIPLLISDSQDAAVLARSDGFEHEAVAFTYKDKLWYNTYPGLDMGFWDTATPKVTNTTDIVAIKEYLVDMLEKAEGMIWIQTGISSLAEFNALKKNRLQVYPISAKQYVSGKWVKVEAMSWKNSEWAKWMFAYYADGEKNVDFTDSGSGHEFTATWDSDFLKLYVKTYNDSSVQFTYTTDKQPIIEMQKISVEYQNAVSDGGGQYSRLFVCVSSDSAPKVTSDSNGFNVSGSVAKAELNLSTIEQSGTLNLDVSSLSGEYTVIVGLIHARFYQSENSISNANITKIEIM